MGAATPAIAAPMDAANDRARRTGARARVTSTGPAATQRFAQYAFPVKEVPAEPPARVGHRGRDVRPGTCTARPHGSAVRRESAAAARPADFASRVPDGVARCRLRDVQLLARRGRSEPCRLKVTRSNWGVTHGPIRDRLGRINQPKRLPAGFVLQCREPLSVPHMSTIPLEKIAVGSRDPPEHSVPGTHQLDEGGTPFRLAARGRQSVRKV